MARRARTVSRLGRGTTYEEAKATLAGWDLTILDACTRGAMASAERHAIVLWFEHDLFDQLALIRTLDLIARLKPRATAGATTGVSLICIGSFPGIDRFVGLGQLTATQLSTLAGTGVPVTAGHFALATDAWHAFRSPDPSDLLEITGQLSAARTPTNEGGPALPFLVGALRRFLAEYPSVTNGLSRTEELALRALLAGATTAGALFGATQAHEASPFMGDSTFFEILRRLATVRVPLVTSTPARTRSVSGPAGSRSRTRAATCSRAGPTMSGSTAPTSGEAASN